MVCSTCLTPCNNTILSDSFKRLDRKTATTSLFCCGYEDESFSFPCSFRSKSRCRGVARRVVMRRSDERIYTVYRLPLCFFSCGSMMVPRAQAFAVALGWDGEGDVMGPGSWRQEETRRQKLKLEGGGDRGRRKETMLSFWLPEIVPRLIFDWPISHTHFFFCLQLSLNRNLISRFGMYLHWGLFFALFLIFIFIFR